MTKEQCEELSKQIHQEFYREVTLNDDFVLNLSKVDKLALGNFVIHLDTNYGLGKITSEFLVNWFESGWNFWFDHENLKYGVESIQLSWIVGKKAIERYEKIKDIDNKYFRFNRKIRADVGVKVLNKFKIRKNRDQINDLLLNVDSFKEQEKKKFYNTKHGLLWCVINTTLYNHNSRLCSLCINKQSCKKTLKENYPNLYKRRGYK